MHHKHLLALSALTIIGIVGCGTDYAGTYKGEATESGTIKIAVPQTDKLATNESPPRKLADQTVTITKGDAGNVVKFGDCELKGNKGTNTEIVVTGDCNVKITNWEGKLPLSATVKVDDQGALTMEVTGTTKNENTVISYDYTFKGKK